MSIYEKFKELTEWYESWLESPEPWDCEGPDIDDCLTALKAGVLYDPNQRITILDNFGTEHETYDRYTVLVRDGEKCDVWSMSDPYQLNAAISAEPDYIFNSEIGHYLGLGYKIVANDNVQKFITEYYKKA